MKVCAKKVMFLIDAYQDPYAGTEQQLYILIEGLLKKGVMPEITLFRHSDFIEKHGFPCPVQVLNITRIFSLTSIKKILQLGRYLQKNNFKLLHTFFIDSSIIAPLFIKLFRCKVVISRRDMGYWYSSKLLIALRINRFFIDAVIANSHAVKQNTHNNELIPLSNIHVIYNGYKNEQNEPYDRLLDEDCLFFPEKPKVIGLVANIRPVKRIDLLISAFSLIKKEIVNTRLVIIGAGDSGHLQQITRDLGVDGDVHFLGRRTDANRIIKQFDVAVSCSDSEGFSNAIIEYIQAMIPVVCTNVGGNPEIIKHNETGFLVPPGDYRELANKIYMALNNPGHARQMAIRAKKHVSKLCNYQTMIDAHIKLYNKVCQK